MIKYGEVFGVDESSWSGGQAFWREGHVFYSFPRSEARLTFRVTPLKKGLEIPVATQILNPHLTPPAVWAGAALPQTWTSGALAMTLSRLAVRTNIATRVWQSSFQYFETFLELSHD